MVKVISQETFDAVVKENIEEFGLDLEEATKDAVEQFKAQVLFILQHHFYVVVNLNLVIGCGSFKYCY